jgi:hypothetical protein
MATIDLGRLGFVNKGTYNNSTTYEKNDLVQFTDGGILSTYLYIDSTAQSGQAPSSSGTAGSRWVYFAKGVADAVASAGNNKVLVTDGSGNLSPLAIGSAGLALKVNSGANGFEFGTAGGIVQVKTANTTAVTSFGSSGGMISGVAVSITPSSASNKILIMAQAVGGSSGTTTGNIQLRRATGSSVGTSDTNIGGGASSGSRSQAIGWMGTYYQNWNGTNLGFHYLDNPNTTSQITYGLMMGSHDGGTYYIGRTGRDSDDSNHGRFPTNLTLMEIASGVL